jgi:pilus assembly protein Flp/PilA
VLPPNGLISPDWNKSASIPVFSRVTRGNQRGTNAARESKTMIEYLKTWLELKTDRRAVTALEYGVIAGVLAVVVVTAFTTLGTGLNNAFTNVSKQL